MIIKIKLKKLVFTLGISLGLLLGLTSTGLSDLNPEPSQSMTLSELEAILTKRLLTRSSEFVYIPHLARHIMRLCIKHGLDPAVALAFIKTESSFRTYAVSPVGAIGLMQVMPRTAAYLSQKYKIEYKNEIDLYNVYINSELGITYIAELRKRFKNDYHFVAAYNWGPTTISREVRNNEFRIEDKQRYVKGILRNIPKIKQHARSLATASL